MKLNTKQQKIYIELKNLYDRYEFYSTCYCGQRNAKTISNMVYKILDRLDWTYNIPNVHDRYELKMKNYDKDNIESAIDILQELFKDIIINEEMDI